MKGLNRVFLIGWLGGDPLIQMSKAGLPYVRLRIAVTRHKKKEDGGWDSQADWYSFVAWGKLAQNCAEHLQKGSPIALEGRLENRLTERDGIKTTSTSIVADSVHFLPNPKQTSFKMPEESAVVA